MAESVAREQGERRRAEEPSKLYNKLHVLALDNGLRFGCNMCLAKFQGDSMGMLDVPDGERYFVTADNASSHLGMRLDGVVKRSCISTGQPKRYELTRSFVNGQEQPKWCMHLVGDAGPKQFPSMQFLFEGAGLTGTVTVDPFHRDWNGIRKALGESGVFMMTLERVLLHNMPSGPWGRA